MLYQHSMCVSSVVLMPELYSFNFKEHLKVVETNWVICFSYKLDVYYIFRPPADDACHMGSIPVNNTKTTTRSKECIRICTTLCMYIGGQK